VFGWHSLLKTMSFGLAYLTQPCLRGLLLEREIRKLLKTWSGRPDSNRRRPAWECVTSTNLQYLGVSDALSRLSQVSPYQSFLVLTLLIKVGSRYILNSFVPCFVWHPMATNNNGPRGNAGHRPIGVKIELSQRQCTPPRTAKKRRKFPA
jgi:hypothetical protein